MSIMDELLRARRENHDLRARLAAVEAERDQWREELTASEKWRHDASVERDYFRARLAKVEALCDVDDGDVVTRREVRAAARGEGDRATEPCRHDGSNGTCAECRLAHLFGEGDRPAAACSMPGHAECHMIDRFMAHHPTATGCVCGEGSS